ncbi:hypothetical protein GGQ99_002343 [Aminobacter niigataensis]|uniref:Uncharacterized protein n=1 Tax=Aminobacter niigataensis TaxID=83265 RepID=A0ABR6L1E9_9HYPH|nr:hypothetical protein [Aminobacter niigataensis]MBB4650588.1 hypothetical protein [Aminobacter niigataensis]
MFELLAVADNADHASNEEVSAMIIKAVELIRDARTLLQARLEIEAEMKPT